jgi:hypothetical protein
MGPTGASPGHSGVSDHTAAGWYRDTCRRGRQPSRIVTRSDERLVERRFGHLGLSPLLRGRTATHSGVMAPGHAIEQKGCYPMAPSLRRTHGSVRCQQRGSEGSGIGCFHRHLSDRAARLDEVLPADSTRQGRCGLVATGAHFHPGDHHRHCHCLQVVSTQCRRDADRHACGHGEQHGL